MISFMTMIRRFVLVSLLLPIPVLAQQSQPAIVRVAPSLKEAPRLPLSMTAQVSVPFSYSIITSHAKGTTDEPLTGFSAANLPPGLSFDSKSGTITGTPIKAGTFSIPLSATNALGISAATLELTVYPEHPTTATTIMHLKGTTDSPFGYIEFLPRHYYTNPDQQFAVVFDLCGAGNISRNSDDPFGANSQNRLLDLMNQAGRTNKTGGTIFDDADVIILSPIPPQWWKAVPLDRFIAYAYSHYRIDRSRVYMVGLSAGGDGTLDYVVDHGSADFAAVVVTAISHDNRDWTNLKSLPMWVFENWNDPFDDGRGDPEKRHSVQLCNRLARVLLPSAHIASVLANYPEPGLATTQPTRDYTAVLTDAGWTWSLGLNPTLGPPLRFTQFKAGGHGGWIQAYESPELWKWLFAQHRTAAPTTNP